MDICEGGISWPSTHLVAINQLCMEIFIVLVLNLQCQLHWLMLQSSILRHSVYAYHTICNFSNFYLSTLSHPIFLLRLKYSNI